MVDFEFCTPPSHFGFIIVDPGHLINWNILNHRETPNHKRNIENPFNEGNNRSSTHVTRQSEMADLARRATRWVGTLSDGNVHVKFHDDRLRNGGDITY